MRPCYQTMARQTEEQIALYARRTPSGEPLPINIAPAPIPNGVPTNSEVQDAVRELMNGRSGGASMMRVEHIKEWLQGIQRGRKTQSNAMAIRVLETLGASSCNRSLRFGKWA